MLKIYSLRKVQLHNAVLLTSHHAVLQSPELIYFITEGLYLWPAFPISPTHQFLVTTILVTVSVSSAFFFKVPFYKWNSTVFVFIWPVSLKITSARFIHVAAKGRYCSCCNSSQLEILLKLLSVIIKDMSWVGVGLSLILKRENNISTAQNARTKVHREWGSINACYPEWRLLHCLLLYHLCFSTIKPCPMRKPRDPSKKSPKDVVGAGKISFFFYLNHSMFEYRREKNLFSPLQYDNSS